MKKKISIIIPNFNEERTIIKILEKIQSNQSNKMDFEVIVVDDASTDNSKDTLLSQKHLFNILLSNEKNFGKGYCVKRGLEKATGEYVIIQDADLEYDPKDYDKFINVFLKFDADGIIGTRTIFTEYTRAHNFFNKLGNKILTFIFNLLNNKTFTDICCCYFAFKKNLINHEKLKSDGFSGHIEILTEVIKNGKNFYEVPINYNGRSILEGKKIRYYHFFPMLIKILLVRFI